MHFELGVWALGANSDLGTTDWECELIDADSECYFEGEDHTIHMRADMIEFVAWNTAFLDYPGVQLLPERFEIRVAPPGGDDLLRDWEFSPNYDGADDCSQCEQHVEVLTLSDLEVP